MSPKEAGACLSALSALGLWAPWKQSAAERATGNEPDTTREATAAAWQRAASSAGVSGRDMLSACQGYTGERWPAPGDVVALAAKARPAAAVGACIRRGREACNVSGLVSVAAHYTDADGIPRVWVGATWCDCDRGRNGASAQAQPAEKNGPERAAGLTVSEHRARYGDTGRLTAYIIGPESWEKYPEGDPRAKPPSAEVLAKAAELAKLGRAPAWTPPAMEGGTVRPIRREWTEPEPEEDGRW